MKDNINRPAFPNQELIEEIETGHFRKTHATSGMSINTYACIHLLIPEAGDEELDTMIRKAWKNRIAENCAQAMVSSIDSEDNYERLRNHAMKDGLKVSQWISRDSVKQADALINELEKQKP